MNASTQREFGALTQHAGFRRVEAAPSTLRAHEFPANSPWLRTAIATMLLAAGQTGYATEAAAISIPRPARSADAEADHHASGGGTLEASAMTLADWHDQAREMFFEALGETMQMAASMAAEGEAAPIDTQTLIFAVRSLDSMIQAFALPVPLLLPLQNGGICAEWHDVGLNVELRFRGPYDVFAVLEDARGVIESLHGRDNDLARAQVALAEFGRRVRA